MAGRRGNQEQVINLTGEDITHNGITFNYSENFNQITELNTENYPGWRRKILYLLTINKLTKYVLHPIVKKLRKRDIREELTDYPEDQFDSSLVYEKNTKNIDITNDITAKWIIINGLGEQTQKLINGNEKTAFQIWNIFQESFTKSKERRKIEIQNKIETMKFDTKTDINIFIANLQNLIDELEKIDNDLSINTKIGILNRCLPEDLRWINVFQHKSWESCCSYVKEIIPNIVLFNLIEKNSIQENNNNNVLFNAETRKSKNYRNNNRTKGKRKSLKRSSGRCNYCGRRGHYFYECKFKKIIYIKIKTKINLIKELKTKENFKTILIM